MIRSLASLAGLALLCGCASSRPGDTTPSCETTPFVWERPAVVATELPGPDLAMTTDVATFESSSSVASAMAATAAAGFLDSSALRLPTPFLLSTSVFDPLPRYDDGRGDDGRNNYLALKAGEVFPTDGDLNAGWMVGAAYGRYFSRLFSLEASTGYFAPDLDLSPAADLYAVPVMANLRVNLPIWLLQAYGGAGIGAMYYNIDGGALDGDGWLGAGNVFVGADITLFDRLGAGLELRYFITDKIRNSDINLDAFTLALSLAFHF